MRSHTATLIRYSIMKRATDFRFKNRLEVLYPRSANWLKILEDVTEVSTPRETYRKGRSSTSKAMIGLMAVKTISTFPGKSTLNMGRWRMI